METKPNPYPGRPYGVGPQSYPLPDDHQRTVKKLRRKCMLENGEPELLFDIPRIVGGGDLANLGHARGGSAFLMARGLQELSIEGHVYSVDRFREPGPMAARFGRATADMEELGLSDEITLCHGTTSEWAKDLKDKRFNFIFIDADHTYAGVERDLLEWSPMLNVGGLVGFHDTNQDFTVDVLVKYLIDKPGWKERTEFHVNRIRVFEKV